MFADDPNGGDVQRLHNTVSRVEYERNAEEIFWPHSVWIRTLDQATGVACVLLLVGGFAGAVAGGALGVPAILVLGAAMAARSRTAVYGKDGVWITDRKRIMQWSLAPPSRSCLDVRSGEGDLPRP